ncbi:MAG: hypothetical protein ABJI69_12080 [Balneola sp.]
MRYLTFLLVVLFFSCSENITSTNPTPEFQKEFEIDHGETLTFEGTEISIRFADVTDFRCNVADIDCVWSGDATILLDVDNQQEEINLYHPDQDYSWQKKPASIISDYQIEFLRLSPEIRKTNDEPKRNYRAKLIVTPK